MNSSKKDPRIEEKNSFSEYDAALALALSSANGDVMNAIEKSCTYSLTPKR
jgi:hypothetical protein